MKNFTVIIYNEDSYTLEQVFDIKSPCDSSTITITPKELPYWYIIRNSIMAGSYEYSGSRNVVVLYAGKIVDKCNTWDLPLMLMKLIPPEEQIELNKEHNKMEIPVMSIDTNEIDFDFKSTVKHILFTDIATTQDLIKMIEEANKELEAELIKDNDKVHILSISSIDEPNVEIFVGSKWEIILEQFVKWASPDICQINFNHFIQHKSQYDEESQKEEPDWDDMFNIFFNSIDGYYFISIQNDFSMETKYQKELADIKNKR